MQKRPYEISLWTYNDRFVAVLASSETPKLGAGYEPKWSNGVNGEQKLTFSIPIIYYDEQEKRFVNNKVWYDDLKTRQVLANEKKVKLIFDKYKKVNSKYIHEIHELIIENIVEERGDGKLICRVECVGAPFKELGKTGTELVLNFETMALEEEKTGIQKKPTIQYWLDKTFPAKLPNDDTVQWSYRIDMSGNVGLAARNKIYEKDLVENWIEQEGQLVPVHSQTPIEKERFIEVTDSNKYNITQTLAETFQVFVRYEYIYEWPDEPFRPSKKEVVFYDALLHDSEYSITYGNNELGLTKKSDSSEVTTKMFVDPIESEYSDDGYVSINKATNNKILDNFILDFSYFIESGQMSSVQEKEIPKFETTIREKNLAIEQAANVLAEKEYELTILEADVASLKSKINGANDNVIDVEDKLLGFDQTKLNYIVQDKNVLNTAKSDPPGTPSVCTLRRRGVLRADFVVKNNANEVITLSADAFQYDEYGFVKSIVFAPQTGITDGALVKLTYNYDLLTFYRNEKATYATIRDAAKQELIKKQTAHDNVKQIIETRKTELENLIKEKQDIVTLFNNKMAPFLKEGRWSESEYKPSFQNITLSSIPLIYDPISLAYEARATYMVGSTKTFYHHILLPIAGVDSATIEQLIITEKFVEAGRDVTCELRYNAQFMPQHIFEKEVGEGTYDTLNALTTANPNHALAYFVIDNGKTYHHNGTSWTELLPKVALVLTEDIKVNAAGHTFFINNTQIPAENLKAGAPFTIAHRRWLFTKTGQYNGERYNNFQTASLILRRSGLILKEFQDYNLYSRDMVSGLTLKLNNNVLYSATEYNAQFKLDVSSEQLYRDALEVSKTSAYPDVSYEVTFSYLRNAYSMSVINPMVLDENHSKNLQLGSIVRITDHEMRIFGLKGIVTDIEMNLDLPEETTFTIQNYKTKFEDLFSRIIASSEQMKTSGYLYDRLTGAFGPNLILDGRVLQQSIDFNDITFTTGSAYNTSFGKQGILTETAEPYPNGVKGQTWIRGGDILLSNAIDANGDRIWATALTPLGISASLIRTGRLDTSQVNIYSGDQVRFSWKADGLFAYGNEQGATLYNTFVRYNEDGLLFLDNGVRAVELGWDGLYIGSQGGSVELTGKNGLEIYNAENPRQLLIKIGGFGVPNQFGVYPDYGMKFYKTIGDAHIETLVSTNNGDLWLRDTLLVGVEGSDGFVGITGDELADDVNDPIRIWAGAEDRWSAPFRVSHYGALYATKAIVSGEINALYGNIGNWIINRQDQDLYGSLTDASGFVGLNPVGTTFWSGGVRPPDQYSPLKTYAPGMRVKFNNEYYKAIAETLGNDPPNGSFWEEDESSLATFYVDASGAFTAMDATVHGAIFASSGSFTGRIVAKEGMIANWQITEDALMNTTETVGISGTQGDISFWAGGARESNPAFYVTDIGYLYARNASVEGTIYAQKGHFSGLMAIGSGTPWTSTHPYNQGDLVVYEDYTYEAIEENIGILPTDITKWKRVDPYSYISGDNQSLYSLKIGDYFTVNKDGVLSATNGEFSGKITAQLGEIGSWIIGEHDLQNVARTIGLDATGEKSIWAGIEKDIFYLTKDGHLFAQDAEIKGKIEATEGHILGRLAIGEDGTYSYISVSDRDPMALKIGDFFRVAHDGTMIAQDANITGTITANEGYLGGLEGWVIKQNLISTVDNSIGLYAGNDEYLVYEDAHIPARIWAGGFNTVESTLTPFLVTNTGKLYAADAEVQGKIVAESGYIKNTFRVGDNDKGLVLHVSRDADGNFLSSFIGSSQFASGAQGYGWAIRDDGSGIFQNVNIRGMIRSTVFEYNRISAVGGSLYVAPTIFCLQESSPIIEEEVGGVSTEHLLVTVPNDAGTHVTAGRTWLVGDRIIYEFSSVLDGELVEFTNKFAEIIDINETNIKLRIGKGEFNVSDIPRLIGSKVNPGALIVFYGVQENRQAIYLTALASEGGPYIDIVDNNLSLPGDETPMPKVRLGRLDGVNDSNFPDIALRGYGLYSQNAYLRGQLMLPGVGVTNQSDVRYSYAEGKARDPLDINQLTPEELTSSIRIWAGLPTNSNNIKDARFIVTENGFVYATAGIFAGIVNATDGIFSGVLEAAGIVIDRAAGSFPYQAIWDDADIHPDLRHFYVAYEKNPQTMDDYILDIGRAGLSIWEGGLRAYSDWEGGWRVGDDETPSEAAQLPYGYDKETNKNPYPYFSLIDDEMSRITTRYLHTFEVERVGAQHHKYTSIVSQYGKLLFSKGQNMVSLNPTYEELEKEAYNKQYEHYIGYADHPSLNILSIETRQDGVAFGSEHSTTTYINVPLAEIGQENTPIDPLTVKGSISVYDNSPGGKGVVSLGSAQIQQALDSENVTIGLNIVV